MKQIFIHFPRFQISSIDRPSPKKKKNHLKYYSILIQSTNYKIHYLIIYQPTSIWSLRKNIIKKHRVHKIIPTIFIYLLLVNHD